MSPPSLPRVGEGSRSPLMPVLAVYAATLVVLWALGIEVLAWLPAWKDFVLGQSLPTAVMATSSDPESAGKFFSNVYALFVAALVAALVVKPPAVLARQVFARKGMVSLIGFGLAAAFVFVNTASPESMLESRRFPIARIATLSDGAMVVSVTAYAAGLVLLAYGALGFLIIGLFHRRDPAAG